MTHHVSHSIFKLLSALLVFCAWVDFSWGQTISLSAPKLELMNVTATETSYKGKNAIRVNPLNDRETIAVIKDKIFGNGVIEVEVAGKTLPNSNAGARGFIGIAFRVQITDSVRYECFYIRPTNGRAEDQLRRNHSTQYISHPKYTWFKLRDENPGVYESYADMVEGEWTQLKIEVRGDKARLFVNGASQPCLIVNDLKFGKTSGAIALWVGPGTDGYFSNFSIGQD